MKKVLSLLLSVCLVLTMIPAITFAAEDDQAAGDENVVPMETQEEIVGEENPAAPDEDVEALPGSEVPEADLVEEPDETVQLFNEGEPEAVTNGWDYDGTGWRYFRDGNYLTGLQVIGATYLFNSSTGYMLTGLRTFDGSRYYFTETGSDPTTSTYGTRQTGWVNVPNVGWCYFNPMMKNGWQTINGAKYYLNPTRVVGLQTINGSKYYFSKSSDKIGQMMTGWLKIFTDTSRKAYFNPTSGRMQTGWATINGYKYYLYPTSGMAAVGWANISGAKYYFRTTGTMYTGWLTYKKNKYYFDKTSGKMKKGFATIDSKTYFFDTTSGQMQKGWLKYKKKKYHLDSKTGVMDKGLKKISKVNYYFNKNSGAMKTNGCEKVSGKLYYFFSSGKSQMKKGWFKGSDKKKRYSKGNGVVATGTKKIGSTWYEFSTKNGVLLKTLGDDIDKKVQSKSSSTKYLVVVYRARYQVRIYTGSKNNWQKQKKFDCAIGKSSTPTTTGTYYISGRGKMNHYVENGVNTRYWYYVYYKGKQGIHSGLYYDGGPNDGQEYDTRVNVKSTNGGVRVSLNHAQWIYNNVPNDTTVVVY